MSCFPIPYADQIQHRHPLTEHKDISKLLLSRHRIIAKALPDRIQLCEKRVYFGTGVPLCLRVENHRFVLQGRNIYPQQVFFLIQFSTCRTSKRILQ